MPLKEVRNRIDSLDRQIIRLLQQRMKLAIKAMKYKDVVCDPSREKSIIRNVLSRKSTLLDSQFKKELYGLIIEKSKQLQESKLSVRRGVKKNSKPKISRNNKEVVK
jgi:chorismate mutase/prephenate dehydratase